MDAAIFNGRHGWQARECQKCETDGLIPPPGVCKAGEIKFSDYGPRTMASSAHEN